VPGLGAFLVLGCLLRCSDLARADLAYADLARANKRSEDTYNFRPAGHPTNL
jgi:hypothetical protein